MKRIVALVLSLLLPMLGTAPVPAHAAQLKVIVSHRQGPSGPIANHFSCFNSCGGVVTAGKKLYIWSFYAIQPSAACAVAHDSQGNSYTLLSTSGGSAPNINTYVTIPATSGTDTITMTTTPCFFVAVVINSTSGFDVGTAGACICNPMVPSITTTVNGDLLFAGAGADQGSFAWTMSNPTEPGWILLDGTGTGFSGSQANLWYKRASTAGTYTATISTNVGAIPTWFSEDSFKP